MDTEGQLSAAQLAGGKIWTSVAEEQQDGVKGVKKGSRLYSEVSQDTVFPDIKVE